MYITISMLIDDLDREKILEKTIKSQDKIHTIRICMDETSMEPEIRNCQTDSWLIMRKENGRLYLRADSDALLIRGVLSIYVYLLDGRLLEEVLTASIDFMEKTTIINQLSVDRFSVLAKLPVWIQRFCEKAD